MCCFWFEKRRWAGWRNHFLCSPETLEEMIQVSLSWFFQVGWSHQLVWFLPTLFVFFFWGGLGLGIVGTCVFEWIGKKPGFWHSKTPRKGLKNRKRSQFGGPNAGNNTKKLPNLSIGGNKELLFFWQIFSSFFQASMRKACANPNLLAAESFVWAARGYKVNWENVRLLEKKFESLSGGGGLSDNFRMILFVLWRHFLVGYRFSIFFVTALNPVNFSGIFFDIDKPWPWNYCSNLNFAPRYFFGDFFCCQEIDSGENSPNVQWCFLRFQNRVVGII